MINLILPHRCSVKRGVSDYSSGSPVTVWKEISRDVPCLFSRRDWLEQHNDTAATNAKASGTIYFDPDADIKTNDAVTVPGIGVFSIGSEGGLVNDYLGNAHHIEYAARQTGAA